MWKGSFLEPVWISPVFFVKNSCELFDQKVGSSQDEKS